MRERLRFYVEADGPDAGAVKRGLAWLVEAAERSGATEAILAMPTKDNIRGTVGEILGEWPAKDLVAGRPVSLEPGVALKLVTQRMWLHPRTPTPVLCVWVVESHLKKIDAAPNVSEMCVVPWRMDEVRPWIDKWKAAKLPAAGPSS